MLDNAILKYRRSLKTGYNILNPCKDGGLEAMTNRSRRPMRYANQLLDAMEAMEAMILRCRQEKLHWGARKIRGLLAKQLSGNVQICAISTVHAAPRPLRSREPCFPEEQANQSICLSMGSEASSRISRLPSSFQPETQPAA